MKGDPTMKLRSHSVKLFLLAMLIAVATPWAGNTTSARQTDSVARTANFGSIGATRGQTVRLTSLVVGPSNIPVEFVFLDAEGNVLAALNDEIMPERFHSFDLNLDTLGRFDGRLQLRALVKYSVHAEHIDVEKLIPSLEVIDNKTGKTTFALDMPEMPECPAP
jgi:hypothetical protein